MKGFIKKDLLNIKNYLKLIIIIYFVYSILALQGKGDISFVPALVSVMIFISTFSYDEYNHWDAYACTLPNGRKSVVQAKYIATLIITITNIIVTTIFSLGIAMINKNMVTNEIYETMLGIFGVTVFIQSIMYPIIFKFGVEKGRVALFTTTFLIAGIVGLFMGEFTLHIPANIINFLNNFWYIIIPIVTIIVMMTSYKISEKIYLNKEF